MTETRAPYYVDELAGVPAPSDTELLAEDWANLHGRYRECTFNAYCHLCGIGLMRERFQRYVRQERGFTDTLACLWQWDSLRTDFDAREQRALEAQMRTGG